MARIDFVKLRKRAGLSQRELADILQVQPSFLSAIENGRSRMPEEKLEKLREIFEIDDFEDFLIDDGNDMATSVAPHTHMLDQSDSLTHLLTHFHDLAHKNSHSGAGEDSSGRIDFLTRRNDRLSERIDDLREEVDELRRENLRLKELLLRNSIEF